VPGGLSLVNPGRGTPAKNSEAPETFRNSLRVKLNLGIF
jgi:hypothetical protein